MLLRVDESSQVPIYAQIKAAVRRDIASGDLPPGARLPTARDLAQALSVNLHTVLRAYQGLRDEGVVELRRGRGAVVSREGVGMAATHAALTAFVQAARDVGLTPDEAADLVKGQMS